MVPALKFRGVHKRFGRRHALRDLTLEVDRGEIVGLLGPNGSGKSTAMRIAAGVTKADRGDVVFGVESASRCAIGYLPEKNPLYDTLRVREMLRFAAGAKGQSARAIDAVIAHCDLHSLLATPIARLSKGMRQRVGLAVALLGDPDLLLLDESTAGLDPLQARDARTQIRRRTAQCATLFSTHSLHEAAALCDRVLILFEGRIVAEHRPEGGASELDASALEEAFLAAVGGALPQ